MDITVGQAQVKLSLMRSVSLRIYKSKFLSFITAVVDTADKHSFSNISVNFRKKSNGPGETDSWIKLEAENLVLDSL